METDTDQQQTAKDFLYKFNNKSVFCLLSFSFYSTREKQLI